MPPDYEAPGADWLLFDQENIWLVSCSAVLHWEGSS